MSEEEYEETESEETEEEENEKPAPKLTLLQAIKREDKSNPKAILMEIMNIIDSYGHNGYRRSWELTIEFLGRYLGLMTNPWIYSDPSMDSRRVIDRTNPRRISAFQVEWIGKNARTLLIKRPEKPYYIFYFAHNYVTQWVSKPEKLEGEKKRLYETLMKKGLLERYVDAARKQPWDHLGDIFSEFQLSGAKNRLGQILTPRSIIEFMITSTLGTLNTEGKRKPYEPITDLDPATGTGRFLIMASLMYPEKPLILYGIEIDITLYRACLVNMAIFCTHPYTIVCADALMLMTDDSIAWRQGNLWNPPDMTQYYCSFAREVNRTSPLSFAELMKLKAERLQAEKDLHIEKEKPIIVTAPTRSGFSLQNYIKSKNKK